MLKILASGLLLALLFGASAAEAHATLEHSSPAAGETLAKAPTEIRLEFSEELWPNASQVALTTESGLVIPVVLTVGQNAAVLIVSPKTVLVPGAYKFTWQVTCIYSHQSQGRFGFTIE